jgi:hypothetical protein
LINALPAGGLSRATWLVWPQGGVLVRPQQGARWPVGVSNNIHHARKFAKAEENIVAFFVKMGAFVC